MIDLNHWTALTRNLLDGNVPWITTISRTIRPWAVVRRAWLFGLFGLQSVMSLVQSAKLNGHDPWAYLRDVPERLPDHPNSRIEELLPHRWHKVPSSPNGSKPLQLKLCQHRTAKRRCSAMRK